MPAVSGMIITASIATACVRATLPPIRMKKPRAFLERKQYIQTIKLDVYVMIDILLVYIRKQLTLLSKIFGLSSGLFHRTNFHLFWFINVKYKKTPALNIFEKRILYLHAVLKTV